MQHAIAPDRDAGGLDDPILQSNEAGKIIFDDAREHEAQNDIDRRGAESIFDAAPALSAVMPC
jgi:hypothetical protein